MTARPDSDGSSPPRGVVAAHAQLSCSDQLIEDRRALYRLVLTLGGAKPEGLTDYLLDDPVVRHAVGEVLGGRRPPTHLRYVSARAVLEGAGPTVVADAATADGLTPTLNAVAQECGDVTPALIVAGDPRFPLVAGQVWAGLDLARELLPELYADLIEHVALVGVLDPDRSGAVVSASSRAMPGVVLLRPGSPLEVAESFVHEAAHQRLFDMALTRDMLCGDADGYAGCRPSWRTAIWPLEQTLAAFHAYACLAELRRALPVAPTAALAPHSLLPFAAARARELGEWLLDRSDLLGADAGQLVSALLGRPEPTSAEPDPPPARGWYRAAELTLVPTAEGRCLVGVINALPQLFWLDATATRVLGILRESGELSTDKVLSEYMQRYGSDDSVPSVLHALDTLALWGLARSFNIVDVSDP